MTHLVVGLGNPGDKYTDTRHNVGFTVVDWLAGELGASDFTTSSQADALVSQAVVAGQKLLLVKPQTFMNNSGEAVRPLADYFDIKPENILVIYDDVDLPLGGLRLVHGRGDGGHRGVRSVIRHIGRDFPRLRVGISPTDGDGNVQKQVVPEKGINPFVMGKFSAEEKTQITDRYSDIVDGIKTWVADGVEPVMNLVN